jgi:hypothetical protein
MTDKKENPESAEAIEGQVASESPMGTSETVGTQPKEPRDLVRDALSMSEEADRKAVFLKFLQTSFKETQAAMHMSNPKSGEVQVAPINFDQSLRAKKEKYWETEGDHSGKKWGYLTLRMTDDKENWVASEGENVFIAIPQEKLGHAEDGRWIAKGSKRLELVPVEQSVLSSGMLPSLSGYVWMAAGSKEESKAYLYAIGYDSGGPSIKSMADEKAVEAIESAEKGGFGGWHGFIMNLAHGKSLSNEAPSDELMLQIRHYATLMMEDEEWKKYKENVLGPTTRANLMKLEWFADIAREL